MEHDYYKGLGDSENCVWKRLFYHAEAWRLKRYEPVLKNAAGIFAISQKDADYFSKRYQNVIVVPGFNAADSVCSELGRGEYVLYHGNLSVRENEDAAKWLIENVFSELDIACIVSGLKVLEETSSTANLLHIRQFGITDGADGVVKLL